MTTLLLFIGLLAMMGTVLFLMLPSLAPGQQHTDSKRLEHDPGKGKGEEENKENLLESHDLLDRQELDYTYETTSYELLEDRSWLDDRRDQTMEHATSVLIELLEHTRQHSLQPNIPTKSLPLLATLQVGKAHYALKTWLLSRDAHALALEAEVESPELAKQVWITGPPTAAQMNQDREHATLGDPLLDRLFSITGMHELALMLPKQREALATLFEKPPIKIDIWPGHARLRWHVRERGDFPDLTRMFRALASLERLSEPDEDQLIQLLEHASNKRARSRLLDALLDLDALGDATRAATAHAILERSGDVDLLVVRALSNTSSIDEGARKTMLRWSLEHSAHPAARAEAITEFYDKESEDEEIIAALEAGLGTGPAAARLENLAALLTLPREHASWWSNHITIARLICGEFSTRFGTESSTAAELVNASSDRWLTLVRPSTHALLDECQAKKEILTGGSWEAESMLCLLELCARSNVGAPDVFEALCQFTTFASPHVVEAILESLVREALRDTDKLELLTQYLKEINLKALPHDVLDLKEHPGLSERGRADLLFAILKRAPDIFKQTAAAKRLISEIKSSPWELDLLERIASDAAPPHRALAIQALATRDPNAKSMTLFGKLLSETSLSAESLEAATEILRIWPDLRELDAEHLELFELSDVYPKMVCLEVILSKGEIASIALLRSLLPDPEKGLTIRPSDFSDLWVKLLDHIETHRSDYGARECEELLVNIASRARGSARRRVLDAMIPGGTLATLALLHQLLKRSDLSEETRRLITTRLPEIEARVGKDTMGALSLSVSSGEGELTIVEHGEGRLTMLEQAHEEP